MDEKKIKASLLHIALGICERTEGLSRKEFAGLMGFELGVMAACLLLKKNPELSPVRLHELLDEVFDALGALSSNPQERN